MKKRTLFTGMVVVMLLLAMVTGCTQNGGNTGKSPDKEPVGAAYPMTVVDDAGRSVEIAAAPQRIVSLMPSLTETLYALGLEDRVVGVTDFCDYPAEALTKEKVGNLFNLSMEKILELEPDLVLAAESATLQDALTLLAENGITVVVINPLNLDAIEESIRQVGKITGVPEKGVEVAALVRAEREALAARVGTVAEADRPNVLILLDTDAIYTLGDGVFLSDMVTAAGGVNAAADKGEGYFQLSEEALFALDPDIIICTFPMSDQVLAKATWQELQAVKNGRVFDVNGDLVSRSGPRIILGLEELYAVFFK